MLYVLIFLASAAAAMLATIAVRRVAVVLRMVDVPGEPRKIHAKPTPLLGGLAVFVSFWAVIGSITLLTDVLPARYVSERFLLGLFIAGLVLMVGGFLDDRYRLRARFQIAAPIIAILVVIGSGMGIVFVSNPLGPGLWHLD